MWRHWNHLVGFAGFEGRGLGGYELTRALFRDDDSPEPGLLMELDNIEAVKRMGEHRLRVTFIPRLAVIQALAAGRLCMVEADDAPKLWRFGWALRRRDVSLTVFLELDDRMSRSPSEV